MQPQTKSITDPKTQDPQLRSNVSHSGNRSTGSPCIATVFPRQMALTCSAPPQRAVSREAAPLAVLSGVTEYGGRTQPLWSMCISISWHSPFTLIHNGCSAHYLPCVVVVYMFDQAERPDRTLRIPNVTKFLNILSSQFHQTGPRPNQRDFSFAQKKTTTSRGIWILKPPKVDSE